MTADEKRGKYTSPEGSKTWENLTTFSCSLLILSMGFVLGWNSPTIAKLQLPAITPSMKLLIFGNSTLSMTSIEELQMSVHSTLNKTSINDLQTFVNAILNITSIDELQKFTNSSLKVMTIDDLQNLATSILNMTNIVELQILKNSTLEMTSIKELQAFANYANSVLNMTSIDRLQEYVKSTLELMNIDELQTFGNAVINMTSNDVLQQFADNILNMTSIRELKKSVNYDFNETNIDDMRTSVNKIFNTRVDELRNFTNIILDMTRIDDLQKIANSILNITKIDDLQKITNSILNVTNIAELQTFVLNITSIKDLQAFANYTLSKTSIVKLQTFANSALSIMNIDELKAFVKSNLNMIRIKELETKLSFYITADEASTLTMMTAFGHMLAPPLIMLVIDRVGRKPIIMLSGVPLAISWSMILVARSAVVLCIARGIAGLATGIAICVVPMYLGEIASTERRGAVGMVVSIMFNLGLLCSYILVPQLSIASMAELCMVIVILFLGSLWFMPESPYILAMLGRREEAEGSLEKLRGRTDVSEEMETIEKIFENKTKAENSGSFKDILCVQGVRKAFFIGLLFNGILQFGGFHTVLVYVHIILDEVPSLLPKEWTAVIFASVQLITSVCSAFIVDRVNRLTIIFISGIISGLSNGVVGLYFYRIEYWGANPEQYYYMPFIGIFVLLIACTCGLLGLQMTIVNEIFPTSIKGKAMCLLGVLSGLMSIAASKLYLMVAVSWNFGHSIPFIVQSIFSCVATIIITWLTPETKGKPFAEILTTLNS